MTLNAPFGRAPTCHQSRPRGEFAAPAIFRWYSLQDTLETHAEVVLKAGEVAQEVSSTATQLPADLLVIGHMRG